MGRKLALGARALAPRGLALLSAVTVVPGQARAQYALIDPASKVAGGIANVYDGPISMLADSAGNLHWITSGGKAGRKTYDCVGPLGDPLIQFPSGACFSAPSSSLGANGATPYVKNVPIAPTTGKVYETWFTSIHKTADGSLLAFLHLEDGAAAFTDAEGERHNGEDFKVALAYSKAVNGVADRRSFDFLGVILDEANKSAGHNIKGAPYLIVNDAGVDYFYVYFNDLVPIEDPSTGELEDTTSVARAPVADVLADANAGRVGSWLKYYRGVFNENGLTGRSSTINVPYWVNTHSDLAHSAHIDRFMWVASNDDDTEEHAGIGTSLLYSRDGINWDNRTSVYSLPAGIYGGSYTFFGAVPNDPSDAHRATAYRVDANFNVYFDYDDNNNIYTAAVTHDGATVVLGNESFNLMTSGAKATGFSTYEAAGTSARIAATPREVRYFISNEEAYDRIDRTSATDRCLHLSDATSSANASVVKGFAATAAPITETFEFRVDDTGSYQAFRLKGDNKAIDAVYLYVFNSRLYWIDSADTKHFVADIQSGVWYSMSITASAFTDTFNVTLLPPHRSPVQAGPFTFYNATATLDAVAFNTGTSGTGDLWVDDLEVYR